MKYKKANLKSIKVTWGMWKELQDIKYYYDEAKSIDDVIRMLVKHWHTQ